MIFGRVNFSIFATIVFLSIFLKSPGLPFYALPPLQRQTPPVLDTECFCFTIPNPFAEAIAFKGKNMRDKSAILSAVGIVDNELCVVVGTKRKEAAKAAAPSTASSSAPAPADPTPAEAPKETTPAPAPAPEQSQAAATAADAFLTGDAVNETVNMIMQMGEWSEEQVKAALSASFNNPDRAVDMLFSGSVPRM